MGTRATASCASSLQLPYVCRMACAPALYDVWALCRLVLQRQEAVHNGSVLLSPHMRLTYAVVDRHNGLAPQLREHAHRNGTGHQRPAHAWALQQEARGSA